MRSLAVFLWIMMGSSWLVGCSGSENGRAVDAEHSSEKGHTQAGGEGVAMVGKAELWAIPVPSFDGLEPAVRERLSQSQNELTGSLDSSTGSELGDSMGKLGMLYHAHGFHDAAEACYLNARLLEPKTFDWAYLLGRLYRVSGDRQRSEDVLEEALALRPDDIPTLFALGDLWREDHRLTEAAAAYDQILRLDSDSAPARIGLGRIALAQEDDAVAVDHLEAALELTPFATEIHYPLGLAYRGLGRLDQAKSHLSRRGSVGAGFDDPLMAELESLETGMRLHLNRGARAFLRGLYQEAASAYRQAVAADPQSPVARMDLAAALIRLGDWDGALEQTQAAIQQDPDHVRANFGMATILAKQGREQDALAFYEVAVREDPSHKDAHFNYANALRRLGQFDLASRHFAEVIRLEPHHATARFAQVLSLAQGESWHEAMALIEEGVVLLDGESRLSDALVRMLSACPVAALRNGERAVPLAEALLRQEQSLSHVEGLAMALAEVGRFSDAVEYQKAAVRAAKASGNPKMQARVEGNLKRYSSDQPCREPWQL